MTELRSTLVDRAIALQPLLREHTAKADLDRRLTDEVDTALVEAGFFRLFTPKRFGGFEADVSTVLEVSEALAEADASAGWAVGVGSVANWMVGQFAERARQEVFGATASPRIVGSNAAVAARRVDGGLRLSGRWSFASGSDRAQWVTLGSAVVDESGQIVGAAMSLVPVSELTPEHTWLTVGMRATASDTWVADDLFVPQHRVLPIDALIAGEHPFPVEEAMYQRPAAPLANALLLGAILGAGREALRLVVAKAPTKPMHHTFFARQSDSVGAQIQIAEAAMKLKTARLHAFDVAETLDNATTGTDEVPYARRAEIRAQLSHAAQESLAAINTLVNVHGAGTFAETNRLQQLWRDANTAARHAALNPYVGYEVHGKDLLGIAERVSPMV